MANREYFQGDNRQDSYEFVGRTEQHSRGSSPYHPQNDPYNSTYGGQPQSQSPYGSGGYNAPAPPARYEPGPPSNYGGSPAPAYNQGYQAYGQQQHDQRPQEYPERNLYGQQQGYGQQQNQNQNQQQQQYGQQQYGQRPQEYPNQGRYGSQQQEYDRPPPDAPNAGSGPGGAQDGDRGILGALGGAAAGGYGGHKMNHGIIGTIGGAVAGSLLEDHIRKPHKEEEKRRKEDEKQRHEWEKEEEKRRKHGIFGGGAPPPQSHHGPPQGHNFRGNFSGSCGDISLDRDLDLIARCGTVHGTQMLSSINLNEYLTNEFGTLKWEKGGNFGGSARNVRLADGGRVLEAELADGSGGWRRGFIHLDERITNDNGELRYVD